MNIQNFIIKALLTNKEYFSISINNLQPSYFGEVEGKIVKFIKNYYAKYENIPSLDVTLSTVSRFGGLSDTQKEKLATVVEEVKVVDVPKDNWILDETKNFVANKAVEEVLMNGVEMLQTKGVDKDFSSIHAMMQKAISINWDEDFGVRYSDLIKFDLIYDELADTTKRIPTGITTLDEAIKGGIPDTTFLGLCSGMAGLGKTLLLQNIAINAIKGGKNVCYLSLEIVERELRRRFDSAFADISIDNLVALRAEVKKRISDAYASGATGEMYMKDYPPGSVNALDIETYLNGLKLKCNFVPDIVIIDYLGIMRPNEKIKSANSYERLKIICEELRSLSGRKKRPFLSAVQLNRGAANSESVGLDNIADSMGIAHTADLIVAITQTDTYKEQDMIRFEVIKSRISKTGTTGCYKIDHDKLKIINTDQTSEDKELGKKIKTLSDDDNDTVGGLK